MSNNEMRTVILNIVNISQGVKNVELALKVMEQINPVKFEFDVFMNALNNLVEEKEVEEIEYTLSIMEYRIKSFYLPKGTSIRINK